MYAQIHNGYSKIHNECSDSQWMLRYKHWGYRYDISNSMLRQNWQKMFSLDPSPSDFKVSDNTNGLNLLLGTN